MNRACSGPEGARPRDGLSSGAASWTDCERSERAARRASKASQSPSPPYSERILLSDMRFLFICNPEYAIGYAITVRLSQDSIALLRTVLHQYATSRLSTFRTYRSPPFTFPLSCKPSI
ncbi:hypothetical protein D6T91_05985 [Salmonella enterica subsp. houtenae]|nr:hypothetical protein [Salmonella enterica subsp. houtenae]